MWLQHGKFLYLDTEGDQYWSWGGESVNSWEDLGKHEETWGKYLGTDDLITLH